MRKFLGWLIIAHLLPLMCLGINLLEGGHQTWWKALCIGYFGDGVILAVVGLIWLAITLTMSDD